MDCDKGFENYSILMCGLLYIGTPLSVGFHYRDYVIFDLDFSVLF